MRKAQADVLLVLPYDVLNFHAQRIAELANQSRLPAIYPIRDFFDAGGLMA